MTTPPLLAVDRLEKHFPIRSGLLFGRTRMVKAVDGVSFHLHAGETLGLVGESGSGKSTTGRAILRLTPHTGGSVTFAGATISDLPLNRFKPYRRQMQMIFQDPASSLNPSYSAAELIEEPMIAHRLLPGRTERREQVRALLEQVGLDHAQADRYPHQFSGGQRQRIGIARALAVGAKFIVADEPVSSLDVSVQSQVLNLMQDLKQRHDLSYLFIAHDLAVVKHMSQRVAVMYLGRIVETASSADIYRRPAHPYTQMLLAAIPRAKQPARTRQRGEHEAIGEIPSPIDPPTGCAFHPRCKFKKPICASVYPETRTIAAGHSAACHLL